jgi:hypothetical protein
MSEFTLAKWSQIRSYSSISGKSTFSGRFSIICQCLWSRCALGRYAALTVQWPVSSLKPQMTNASSASHLYASYDFTSVLFPSAQTRVCEAIRTSSIFRSDLRPLMEVLFIYPGAPVRQSRARPRHMYIHSSIWTFRHLIDGSCLL